MKSVHEIDSEFGAPDAASTSRSFIQVIWQRKAFVILGACVGLTLAFLWHTQKPNVYSTQAQLLVTKKESINSSSTADSRTHIVDDFMSTHLVLLKSPNIINHAITKSNLN